MQYPLYEIAKDRFPGALAEIPDKPKMLYVRGALPPAEHKLLAVVGSRKYSTYGKQAVELVLGGLSGYPITIISGLAIGIDCLAHRAALDHTLNTIAVPGSGLAESVLYPAQNRALAHEILASGGGLISEFEPDFRATDWSFPQRNRIMAGMADAVLVIEATLKSGTLITSRLATDYNRDVLTVPGSIFSQNSDGPHMLIKLGATPVTSAEDVIFALGLKPHESPALEDMNLTPQEKNLLELLSSPRSQDELIRHLALSHSLAAPEANALIMTLELQGHISKSNGTFIRRRTAPSTY
ncbi:DNA-protecting protein DprA [Candidatus Kaiserbacteria bacterium]|nr:DNA-protecting protein DprA [Candidatus Kaiserbacteria bacterium]